MKNSHSFYLFLFAFIPSILFSQISITQSDYSTIFAIGNTNTSFVDTLTEYIDIGQPGEITIGILLT